jgi:xylulokinase
MPIDVPAPGEYVAEGAAIQAAWAVTGTRPDWDVEVSASLSPVSNPAVMQNYLEQAGKY